MSRTNPLHSILAEAGLAPRRRIRRQPTSTVVRPPAAVAANCVHFYTRSRGGTFCKYCSSPSPFSRAGHRVVGRPVQREKVEQQLIIRLLVLAGCKYSAKDET